ncbi:MAG TPA: ABC transporter permease [Myxococcota bacterium]|jgi:ABC-type lipoprotein release transport system permease subunit
MALPLSYSVRSLFARKLRTGLTIAVIALVVIAVSLILGLASSLRRTLASSGDPRNLVIMRKGSDNDGSSSLTLQSLQDIRFFEGIARGADGEPLLSPELVSQPFFRTRDGGRENVLVRGVEATALAVHEDVHIVEGRMFAPSAGEAIVGRGVAGRYAGASVGEELEFGRGRWRVVGIFESRGSSYESEVWADARQVAADAKRLMPYSSFRVRVADGTDMDALIRRIGDDPRHALEAQREVDYYAELGESASQIYVLVVFVALFAGIGAMLGATNTLYAAVQARVAEIGTLRALGFSRAAILRSFLVESLLTAGLGFAFGAVIAVALAAAISAALGGISWGAETFTTNVIQLRVGPNDLAAALGLALAIGVIGGFFPARRAANLRPIEALRKA